MDFSRIEEISKTTSTEPSYDDEKFFKTDKLNYKINLNHPYKNEINEFKKYMRSKEIYNQESSSEMCVENINRDKLNMIVHADIIKTIISDCASKILVCGLLPYLISHHIEILSKQLPAEIVEFIKHKVTSSDTIPRDVQRKYSTVVDSYVDLDLVNLNILMKNKCLKDLAPKFKKHALQPNKNLYDALNEFIEVISKKLEDTAEEITSRHRTLSNGYRLYKERMFYITRNQQKFEQHELEVNQKIRIKDSEIELLKKKIATHLHLTKRQINDVVDESEHKMKKKSVIVGGELIERQEKAEQSKAKYQTLLANHLALEKELRKKKRRVESTLQNWLGKFDDDMLVKQAEVDMLTESLEQESEDYNELQCLFLEDNKRFEKYSKEKRLEDDAALKAKALEFLWDRSALLIQRTWKEYKRVQALKRKRRKKN